MKRLNKKVYLRYISTTRKIKIILRVVICILILVFLGILPSVIGALGLGEFYSSRIFPVISLLPNSFSDLLIFSMTEYIVVLGIPAFVTMLICFLVSLNKHKRTYGRKSGLIYFLDYFGRFLIVVTLMFAMYILMHGINFRRVPILKHMEIKRADEDFDIYYDTLVWAYENMLSARSELGEDYMGVAHPSMNFDQMGLQANSLMDAFSDEYDLNMSRNLVKPKSVSLSHLWAYTYIAGMYDPIIGEANINTDYMDVLNMPVTICHEVAHCKGYASETEANTAAVLACIHSNVADFRYAGYYEIYTNLYSTVYMYAKSLDCLDKMAYFSADSRISMVYRDMAANEAYFASLEQGLIPDIIRTFSHETNNAFLVANGQEGGSETYHVPSNNYVNFYYTYVLPEAGDANN